MCAPNDIVAKECYKTKIMTDFNELQAGLLPPIILSGKYK